MKSYRYTPCLIFLLLAMVSCERFIQVDPPSTDLTSKTVFESDVTANAAIADVYSSLIRGSSYMNGGVSTSFSYRGGLSADELELYSTSSEQAEFHNNKLLPTNSVLISSFWSAPYQHIYKCNSILEGLKQTNSISEAFRKRLTGEAKFIRALSFFYLVNMFGDIPIVLSTDYRVNANISRSDMNSIYDQIVADLKDAEASLDSNYLSNSNLITIDRIRANKFAAKALLARVYLYTRNWQDAETKATEIIQYSSLYNIEALDRVFLKNSKEAIWQLIKDDGNPSDAITFNVTTVPTNAALRKSFVESFEGNDQRKNAWIGTRSSATNKYYYPLKYKNTSVAPITEYFTVLRLGEVYLIRAEARINQEGKVAEGISDLNVIRKRAGLEELPVSSSVDTANKAMEQERMHELFTELGHRWFDLKRWPSKLEPGSPVIRRADDVLKSLKPGWKSEWKLYPIPEPQIINNPAMANQQNPGYN